MPDEPLTPTELDLVHVATSAPRLDPLLDDLADFADGTAATVVGLALNGMFAFGALGPRRAMAEVIDTQLEKISRASLASLSEPDPDLEENLRKLATFNTYREDEEARARDEMRGDAEAFVGEKGFDFDRAPAELTRRLLRLETRLFLTLQDAQIITPGQAGVINVPVLRVAASQISAWWIIPTDEQGSASFQLWTTPQQEDR
jgi:hypothetical protein